METPLLILAAGMGRRFGGLKQLEPVGPGGAALMDYTVFDGLRSGLGRVVLVIRRENENAVRAHVESGFGRHVRVDYAFQELEAGRTKPWGTAHGVLAAREALDGRFAVANADDYYGAPAIDAIGRFLASADEDAAWAMVGFSLADTLPAEGPVSRAVVGVEDGWMRSIEELHGLRRHPDGACHGKPESPRVLDGNNPVSMNLWGFDLDLLRHLERGLREFLANGPGAEDEYPLPTAVGRIVATTATRVRVLTASSRWCGMTSAADREQVRRALARSVAEGKYPEQLWD